jgi:hypothetical protein
MSLFRAKVKVPPINLWNVNEVYYLAWRYSWMLA